MALCVFILWLKLFVATSWLLLCFPLMLCALCLHLMVTTVYMLSCHCYCVLPSHGYHCACCHLMVIIVCCCFMVITVHVAISWLLLCVCVCCHLIVIDVCVWLSHGYCCVCCQFMITAVCCQFMVTIVFVLQKWGGNCPQDHQECGEIPRGSQAGNQCP